MPATSRYTAVTARQRQVLDVIREQFQGELPGTNAHYRAVARRLGITDHSSVLGHLCSLRGKGQLTGHGPSVTRPERWTIPVEASTNCASPQVSSPALCRGPMVQQGQRA
jgi:hypothetical protein